jgi:hypothetical protein
VDLARGGVRVVSTPVCAWTGIRKAQRPRRRRWATHLATAIGPDKPRGHQLTGLLWRLLHGCPKLGAGTAAEPPRRVRLWPPRGAQVNTLRRVCYHMGDGAFWSSVYGDVKK